MINLQQVHTELACARRARIAVEAVECEIEALVTDMQNHAWQRVALSDETYDPHLFRQRN